MNLYLTRDANGVSEYNTQPMGKWAFDNSYTSFFHLSTITDLSEAEKEAFLLQIRSAYCNDRDVRFAPSWSGSQSEARDLFITMSNQDDSRAERMYFTNITQSANTGESMVVEITSYHYLKTVDSEITDPFDGIYYTGGYDKYSVVLNSNTGEVSSTITLSAG